MYITYAIHYMQSYRKFNVVCNKFGTNCVAETWETKQISSPSKFTGLYCRWLSGGSLMMIVMPG